MVRPKSGLLTTLIVSLLWYVKVNTLGTLYEEDLDRAYYPFEQFYLNYYTKFLYSLFNTFILDSSPQTLQHAIGTWYCIFSLCQANSPFCLLQWDKRKGQGYSSCINSVQNLMGTLSSSLCQMLNKETVGLILVIGLQLLTIKFSLST